MNKEEQVKSGFREIYTKLVWLNKFKMEDRLKEFKSSEVHCIEYIGKNADTNVTKLAEAFYMTNGAISKIAKKLTKKGVIESYQKPDNKKEIYFKLTDRGRAVFDTHEALHKEFQERDRVVFEHVTSEQYSFMLELAEKYSKHLDAELKKQGLDLRTDKIE